MKSGFGVRLKKLRNGLGLTQAQLAERLKKSTSAVKMWETGANEPDMATLVDMSILFDCSLDYLLCRDEKNAPMGAVRSDLPVYPLSGYSLQSEPTAYHKIDTEYLNSGNSLFWLRVDTAEMEGYVPKGALVLIKKADAALEGELALAFLNGKSYFRKVRYCDGGLFLCGGRLDVSPVFVPCDDDSFIMVGTAVEYRFVY